MSARNRGDVDLLDLEDRINAARHTAALAALAVNAIFHDVVDKDALQGLESLLHSQRDRMRDIGRDLAKVRSGGRPVLKLVADK